MKINELLKKYNIKPISYLKKGKVTIVTTKDNKYVIKKTDKKIYNYLHSRSFNYFPKIICYDDYLITEYIDEVDTPVDQKMLDLIILTSLLHNKTTFYRNASNEEYDKIYNDLNNNIECLFKYYDMVIMDIEQKLYMKPDEFLLITNISIVFESLKYALDKLNEWYDNLKEKERVTLIHKNLNLDHFIKNKEPYLISFDKAEYNYPIYDLYILYKRYYNDFDFKHLFNIYQEKYPLKEEEINLFLILLSIPDKIELNYSIYNNCKKINSLIDYLAKTKELKQDFEDRQKQNKR